MPARIVPDVVREHAALAAFFWAQRDTLMQEDPPPDPAVIAGIDRRLEANLDGLRIAGAAAWPFIIDQYEDYPEKGELFVAAVMAIEQQDQRRIEQVIQFVRNSPDAQGFVGALAWLALEVTGLFVRDWLDSGDAFKQWLGASALAEHRADPGSRLDRLLMSPDAKVRAKAHQLAGTCLRKDSLATLKAGLADLDSYVRFWAAWALVELGADPRATTQLKNTAICGGPDALAALRSVVKAGPQKAVREWLRELLGSSATAPLSVRGAGMLGDRSILPWLVERMRDPSTAVAAAASFLEVHGDVGDKSALFLGDYDQVLERFGPEFAGLRVPVPIAEEFQKLLDTA